MEQDLNPEATAQPAVEAATVEPVASTPPERQVDLAYVAQLEQFARQQQAELNRYEAVKEDVAWMLEDESRLQGIRRYKKSYEEASKPQFDPSVEPVVKYIDDALAPVKAYVTREEANRTRSEQQAQRQFNDDNMRFMSRLTAEHKLTPEQQMKLAGYADAAAQRLQRNVTIEEAWKDMAAFGGPKTEAAKAPVLRSDAGEIGVPGPSKNDDKVWLREGGLHEYITGKIAEARKTA